MEKRGGPQYIDEETKGRLKNILSASLVVVQYFISHKTSGSEGCFFKNGVFVSIFFTDVF